MVEERLVLTGLVISGPVESLVWKQIPMVQFRVKTKVQHFDLRTGSYTSDEVNRYTVTCFANLARNVLPSIKIGDQVIVVGLLKIRSPELVEIEASTIGLDLTFKPVT